MKNLAVSITVGAVLVLVPSSPGYGAVTIGSNLNNPVDSSPCGFGTFAYADYPCSAAQVTLPSDRTAPGGVISPINGVLVRWRVKSGDAGTDATEFKVRPHLIEPGKAGKQGALVNLPLHGSGGISIFNERLPIKVGDIVGLDFRLSAGPGLDGAAAQLLSTGAGTYNNWFGNLGEDASRPPDNSATGELLVNADIEADKDGDGFGDETQDLCPTDSTTQTACVDRAAPNATTSFSSVQNILKQKAVIVHISSTENGTAIGIGTINIPKASKVYTLTPVNVAVTANKRVDLKLKLSKKALKKLSKALRKRKKVKASVTALVKDGAGNASGATKVSVRARR